MGILVNFEIANVRLCYHHFWIAQELRDLSFNVAKCPTNTQSPWKNSMWPQNNLSVALLAKHRSVLVYLTATLKNALNFNWVGRLMII